MVKLRIYISTQQRNRYLGFTTIKTCFIIHESYTIYDHIVLLISINIQILTNENALLTTLHLSI